MILRNVVVLSGVAILTLMTGVAWAQQPGTQQGARTAVAVQTGEAIAVDGQFNEAAWAQAKPVTAFLQKDPREGEAASEATEVRILYSSRAIYFAIHAKDSTPDGIRATELRRDNDFSNDDSFSLVLDTFHDRRNAFLFRVNPQGTQYDALLTDEGRINDVNWDEQWSSSARITDDGWQAEIAIPFKSLRISGAEQQTWGLDFERVIRRKNEFAYWSNWHRGFTFVQVSQAGSLTGLRNLDSGLKLRIKPFVKTELNHISGAPPTQSDTDSLSDIGLEDVKWRVTPDFTADFTVNTDFAETDVDAQVLNLSRFPVFFPEKREFFVEGGGIFDYGPGGGAASEMKLFFSRRIGLSPDPERATIPIIAGAKLTGRSRGWTLGLLNVETEAFRTTPRRNFSVLRVKKDVLERSNIGFIATNRDSVADPQRPGDPYNRGVGVDANFFLLDHLSLQGFLTSTYSPGKSKDHWAGRWRAYWDSDLWFANAERLTIQRNFNPEMGWLPRGDMHKNRFQFDLKPRPGIPGVRQMFIRATVDYITNQARVLETRNQDFTFETAFETGDRSLVRYSHLMDRIKRPFRIQGRLGVPLGDYAWDTLQVRFTPATQRRLSGDVSFKREWGFYGGDNTEFNWSPVVKATQQLSFNPSYQFNRVRLPGGDFTSHLINSQVNYAFNNKWLTSGTVQYSNLAHLVVVNFRLDYIYRPGDDFFLIYNQSRVADSSDTRRLNSQSIIAKLTHSFDF